jgi:hypothetical protein
MLIPIRSWESILGFFRDLESRNEYFRPMRALVEHIATQPYAELIFATTSMHALLVAQHREIGRGHDVLRVERAKPARGRPWIYGFSTSFVAFVKPSFLENLAAQAM